MNHLLHSKKGALRSAGAAQGVVIAVAAFFPIMAIVSLAPAVPKILQHFAGSPNASVLVPLMVTAPGIMVTLFSPWQDGSPIGSGDASFCCSPHLSMVSWESHPFSFTNSFLSSFRA